MSDLNRIDTARLLNRSRDGDSIAIEELIRSHEARIYRLALAILNDPAEADEATLDTFVTAINRLAAFRGESTFTTWLYAIALNVCRGRLRKRRNNVPSQTGPPGYFRPVRGFGLWWRGEVRDAPGPRDVREVLGWAVAPEQAFESVYQ